MQRKNMVFSIKTYFPLAHEILLSGWCGEYAANAASSLFSLCFYLKFQLEKKNTLHMIKLF